MQTRTTQTVKLKPCRSCGTAAVIWEYMDCYLALCPQCGDDSEWQDTPEEAAEIWNKKGREEDILNETEITLCD